jgi:hypothetical protein
LNGRDRDEGGMCATALEGAVEKLVTALRLQTITLLINVKRRRNQPIQYSLTNKNITI